MQDKHLFWVVIEVNLNVMLEHEIGKLEAVVVQSELDTWKFAMPGGMKSRMVSNYPRLLS